MKAPADEPNTDDQTKEDEKPVKEEEEPQQKIYTESELKGMNKIEQKAIAIDLGGDLSQLKDKMKELPIFSSINSNKKKQESKDDADLS